MRPHALKLLFWMLVWRISFGSWVVTLRPAAKLHVETNKTAFLIELMSSVFVRMQAAVCPMRTR